MNVAFTRDAALGPEIRRIVNAAYRKGEEGLWKPEWERTDLPRLLDEIARGEIAVARGDDGVLHGSIRTFQPAPHAGELGLLAVDPDRQGAGTGSALVGFAEATARERGATEMRLELLVPRHGTHPAKERLHAWYAGLGYKIAGVGDFVALYPEVEDLLAVPCDLRQYRKLLAM